MPTPSPVRTVVISMQRNEGAILPTWLLYYDRLVGLRNVVIVDNGSDQPAMLDALRNGEARGVTVLRRPGREVFDAKGPQVQELARSMADRYDVFLPLDADEFLCHLAEGDKPDPDPAAIHAELERFVASGQDVGLQRNTFNNVPGTTDVYWKPARKLFMRTTSKRPLTKGFHYGPNFTNGYEARLCHVHFHNRPSAEAMRTSALLKLPEDVLSMTPDEREEYDKAGRHMKNFLEMTEDDYRARSAQLGRRRRVYSIAAMFDALGAPVPYSAWTGAVAGG